MKKIWTQFVRECSPKCLETINVLSFQNYFELLIKLLFCTMDFEVTCFKIGF